jgi:hypothetical protein
MMVCRALQSLPIFLIGILSIAAASADDTNSPYIDSIKKTLPQEKDSTGYTDSVRQKLPEGDSSEGYTEQLKHSDALQLQGTPGKGYTVQEKEKLGPDDQKSAIEAVREGHSELQLKKPGEIHNAFGIRYGLGLSRTITATDGIGTGRDFNSIYGASYSPDISLFYEQQFFHSEIYGSVGAFAMGTVAFFNGTGQFAVPIINATNGTLVNPTATGVSFRFFEFPAIVGMDYRFNLAKYLRPYVMGGPALVGFYEGRTDGNPGNHGLSHGLWGAIGVDIPVDWLSKSQDWDRYDSFGIKRTSLSIEYSRLNTFSSPIDFSIGGLYTGFVFEL